MTIKAIWDLQLELFLWVGRMVFSLQWDTFDSCIRGTQIYGYPHHRLLWFELAGVSWSEFAAGTLQAQLGYVGGESGRLNLAETRVVSVPGEGLEPSRGKPSQDFKSCAFFVGRARIKMTGQTCVWSVGEVLLRPTKTPLFNLGHSLGHSWPISGFSEQLDISLIY